MEFLFQFSVILSCSLNWRSLWLYLSSLRLFDLFLLHDFYCFWLLNLLLSRWLDFSLSILWFGPQLWVHAVLLLKGCLNLLHGCHVLFCLVHVACFFRTYSILLFLFNLRSELIDVHFGSLSVFVPSQFLEVIQEFVFVDVIIFLGG